LNKLLHNLAQNLNTLQKNLPTPQYGLGFKCPHAERIINENKMKYMKRTRKHVRGNKLDMDTMSFESVQSFKYIGSNVHQSNTIEEEIKERLIAGNKAFYANQKMLQKNCHGNPN
jgi:hypothetical protein